MNRSLVRPAACVLAAAALTLTLLAVPSSSPLRAATVTINAPSCASFTFDGSTLTCQAGTTTGAPSGCSLTASPSSFGSAGGTTNLAMNCTGGDPLTSCNWTQGGVPGNQCN